MTVNMDLQPIFVFIQIINILISKVINPLQII